MIPKTFTLVNRKWKVILTDNNGLQAHLDRHWNHDQQENRIEGHECKGFCDQGEAAIYINIEKHGHRDDLEHTYHHELIHALLYANGLNGHDEAMVDRLGGFLHQVHQTKKGEQ